MARAGAATRPRGSGQNSSPTSLWKLGKTLLWNRRRTLGARVGDFTTRGSTCQSLKREGGGEILGKSANFYLRVVLANLTRPLPARLQRDRPTLAQPLRVAVGDWCTFTHTGREAGAHVTRALLDQATIPRLRRRRTVLDLFGLS